MGLKNQRLRYQITSLNPEVTGSCHLVTVCYPDGRKTNFIMDCGLYQEKLYNKFNDKKFPFKGENIEFALITHSHADHMGRLPYLVKEGFRGNIYATQETVRLMNIALADSFKIEKENAKKQGRKPMYDEFEFACTLNQMVPCKFKQVEYVDRNIKVTFFKNGHLYGAARILVQISYPGEKDINLLFTGDYKPDNIFFEVEDLPDWVYELPITVVTEATYGHMDTTEVSYHMESDLEKAIKNGETVLITVFAQGRAQEVLFLLKDMQRHGKISTEIPIILDGRLAQEYTNVYQNADLLIQNGKDDFLPENFIYVSKETRGEILNKKSQQIILSTSGMADHGPAQMYLDGFVERRDVLIYIPGYTSPDTLGYKLQHPVDGQVVINGKTHAMNAEVITTNECSSHAKANEIIDFLMKFNHLNLVLINHGQKDVKEQFSQRVEREVSPKCTGILGEYTFSGCAYGYIKHMPSKWIYPELESETGKAKNKKKPEGKKKKDRFSRKNHRKTVRNNP